MNSTYSDESSLFHYLKSRWYFKFWVVGYLLVMLLAFIFFILPKILPTQVIKDKQVKGLIFRNQIWEGSIRVVGDVQSFPGSKIIIRPGTSVYVAKGGDQSNLVFLPWYKKSGINSGPEEKGVQPGEPFWDENVKIQLNFFRLEAIGTSTSPIIITSEGEQRDRFDFNLISVSFGQLQNVQLSNYRRFEIGSGVSILDSRFERTGDCSICMDIGEPQIQNNTFQDSKKYFIDVGSGSPRIIGNKFLKSVGDGMLFNGNKDSNLKLSDNFFDMSDKVVIRVIQQEEGGSISGNFFSTGNIELPCSSKVEVENNVILGQVIFEPQRVCPETYNFGNNFWGIKNPQDILNARIVGRSDKFDVSISSVLPTAPFSELKFK